jgi:hypothetical protein
MPDSERSDGHVELLTGEALESVLAVLPEGVAYQVTSVALVQFPSAMNVRSEPHALWLVPVCVDHHTVVHIGHEDPVTHTSVYDGSLVTSQAC